MKKKQESPYKYIAMISQIGISVIVPIGLMIFVGTLFDRFFHTGNTGIIICAILGVLAGFRNLYIIPLRLSEQAQKDKLRNKEDEEKNENENH